MFAIVTPIDFRRIFGMETGSGSLQTSPLGDGAVNGSGSLGTCNRCKVACSASQTFSPSSSQHGDTLSLRHFVLNMPWESGSCPVCEGRCVLTLWRHTCTPPLQDPSRCVCSNP